MLRTAPTSLTLPAGQVGPLRTAGARVGHTGLVHTRVARGPLTTARAEPSEGSSTSSGGATTQTVEPVVEETAEEAPAAAKAKTNKPLGKGVNLFDPAATMSRFITRRFGLVGGLGFVGFLASTEGYEIVKALLETDKEGSGEVITTPSGLVYKDIKVGGGPSPKKGDFVGANFVIKVGDTVLLDTKANGRPIAFTFGKKPYSYAVCEGVEEAVSTMRRGGVRELVVPPELGYGTKGAQLPNGSVVPPGATLSYTVSLEEVTGSYL